MAGAWAIVPYIMPGFALAKKAAEVFDGDPAVEGLILFKHGIFTFGADAREAYERMIAMVTLAEERLQRGRRKPSSPARALPPAVAPVAEVAPILRGACALADDQRRRRLAKRLDAGLPPLATRSCNYVDGAELAALCARPAW